jgi:hypothetical protein
MNTPPSPRVEKQLHLHAGRAAWGENDGSLASTLKSWGLTPDLFLDSLEGWGYEIVAFRPVDEPDHCPCPDHVSDACLCNQHGHEQLEERYWGRSS